MRMSSPLSELSLDYGCVQTTSLRLRVTQWKRGEPLLSLGAEVLQE